MEFDQMGIARRDRIGALNFGKHDEEVVVRIVSDGNDGRRRVRYDVTELPYGRDEHDDIVEAQVTPELGPLQYLLQLVQEQRGEHEAKTPGSGVGQQPG